MRLFFLRPASSSLANSDQTLLNSISGELLGPLGATETHDPDSADAIILNEPWAFREWRYIDRLLADPVVGRFPHKTYTINVDDAPSGLLRGAYTSLPKRKFLPALHVAAPYSLSTNELVLREGTSPRPAPRYIATWRGNTKSNKNLRSALVRHCGRKPGFLTETTDSWMNHGSDEKRHYVDLLRSGKFSLCPAGWAPSTFRVYESMALGVAPVIIADQFELPAGPKWDKCSIRVPESDLAKLVDVLRAHEAEYDQMGALARAEWDQHFSPLRLPRFYARGLFTLMNVSAQLGSREQEIHRWRSLKTYWLNEWTVLQRLRIKLRNLTLRP